MTRIGCGATLALLGVLLGGCDTVVGGGTATVEVFVVGGSGQGAPSASEWAGAAVGEPQLQAGAAFEGTITARLRVALVVGSGFPVTISGGEREVQVDVAGEVPTSLGTFTLSPGVYQGLNVIFTSAAAELTSGLGDGDAAGAVTVDFGSEGAVVLDRDATLGLQNGSKLKVTINLGAAEWLASVATLPEPRLVSAGAFSEAVSVAVRIE